MLQVSEPEDILVGMKYLKSNTKSIIIVTV